MRALMRSKSSSLERHAGFARDGHQVEHRVRGSAGRRHGRDRVLERLARDDLRGAHAAPEDVHHQRARALRRGFLSSSVAGTSPLPIGAMPRNSQAVAMVFAVNWPPQAPAPGHADVLDLAQIRVRHPAGGVRADRLEHVLDRDVASLEPSGRNRPAVENQPGNIEPCERHRGAGNGLVAADQDDERVEQVAARHELDLTR